MASSLTSSRGWVKRLAGSARCAEVTTPTGVPPIDGLMEQLDGHIPNGISVVVTTSLGEEIDGGVVGG